MLAKKITITNSVGDSIDIGHDGDYRLIDGFDLSGLAATLNRISGAIHGVIYQSTRLQQRDDFDIQFFIYKQYRDTVWVEDARHKLFAVLNPLKNPMRIDFTTKANKAYYINAELLSLPILPQGFDNDNGKWQKGLLQLSASDPLIYEEAATRTDIALWRANLEFPLELPVEGIEVGYREPSLIANVVNNGSNDTGMDIRFSSLSEVVTPQLININTYEQLKLNMTMLPGDVVEVSTYRGHRKVTLIRNNVRSNIFSKVDLSSTFLQLRTGDNLFRYDASSGLDFLEIAMTHRNTLVGV